ncbi:hypothetical protein EW145_g8100 [Phellinidium pouzarii]|uniref:Uncharacterized protein n=1 Tax=Phellinidium pouzarii TaxID=167371 RepID=A0A4S4K9R2_9AGAM|nr:hypothetical protein EW145_g8100 [Phellinidium pouzarii]
MQIEDAHGEVGKEDANDRVRVHPPDDEHVNDDHTLKREDEMERTAVHTAPAQFFLDQGKGGVGNGNEEAGSSKKRNKREGGSDKRQRSARDEDEDNFDLKMPGSFDLSSSNSWHSGESDYDDPDDAGDDIGGGGRS